MIRVIIGDVESALNNISESWINQQINRRRADGQNVCVRVIIHHDKLNMVLSTPSCRSESAGRPPNNHEQELFDCWEQCGLNKERFTGGNLIAFLKKLKSL
jgi:hypothetical protein